MHDGMAAHYGLGLDFGTESVRAMLVDVSTGSPAATAVTPYPNGVIDSVLPGTDVRLAPEWALQDSNDWLTSMATAVRAVVAEAGVAPDAIVGLGIDFTACTVLPTTADGTPLHSLASYANEPHAWPKLWKHHAAQRQADRVNELALANDDGWFGRYGRRISSEWLLPKALQVLEERPDVYAASERIVEGADWVAWQLTGRLARNACTAGYKAIWHKATGYPSRGWLAQLDPRLADLYETRVAGPVVAPGTPVGELTPAWAARLGLAPGTPVAAPIIDAHAAVLGSGVSAPGTMVIVMGTSSCHLLLADREVQAEGISGVVEDGILPGLFGYEAGQAGVGDVFAWFVREGATAEHQEAARQTGRSVHDVLSERAGRLRPAESGLLALDWWNGCRTPLVDADLSGLILGFGLHTTGVEIYRALIEATAFGTRLIIDTFAEAGLPVERIRVGGGLTKNDLAMGIYADVIGLPVEIAASEQASALGAAMLGAVAGGAFDDVADAVRRLASPPRRVVAPDPDHHVVYGQLYHEYRRLVDLFGRDPDSPMKRVRALRG